MDIGDEGMMCNAVCDALLELAKPSTVSELASHLKVKEDRVQHALVGLKQTGLVSQGGGRWFMAGQSEAFDESTDQKVFAPSKELGSMRMRSRSPERGAMCPEKRVPSPEEKLQGRPVGQKDLSYAVVPVLDKRIVNPSQKAYTVGSSNMEITTRKSLQCVQISDPGVQENIDKISLIIKCLESESGGLEAKDISKKCNLGDAKRFANPLLYHLEKKQLVVSENIPGTPRKIWKLGPKRASEQQLIEYAVEKSNTTRKGTVGVTGKTPAELHLHNHYHQHTHKNYIQLGENNTMIVPQELEEHKKNFERSAEEEFK